jgi:hypothetical protein
MTRYIFKAIAFHKVIEHRSPDLTISDGDTVVTETLEAGASPRTAASLRERLLTGDDHGHLVQMPQGGRPQSSARKFPGEQRTSVSERPPGSYGVRFVKPFFHHLVASPCWKEGSEGWLCWS